jgi:hypothetical protein
MSKLSIESCESGKRVPICPPEACLGCNFCGVAYASDGNRAEVCTNEFIGPDTPVPCSTAADCSGGVMCIRFPR